jgi:hypothetical protein
VDQLVRSRRHGWRAYSRELAAGHGEVLALEDRAITIGPKSSSYEATHLCLTDPGNGIDLTVRADPRTLARIYMGDAGLARALRERTLVLDGPGHLVRGFARWFGISPPARIDRPPRRSVVVAL